MIVLIGDCFGLFNEICGSVVIYLNRDLSNIYGHRLWRTRLPVRLVKDKPQIG